MIADQEIEAIFRHLLSLFLLLQLQTVIIADTKARVQFTPPSATQMECSMLTQGKSVQYIIPGFVVRTEMTLDTGGSARDWSCTVKMLLAQTRSFALSRLRRGRSLPPAATPPDLFIYFKSKAAQRLCSQDGNNAAICTSLIPPIRRRAHTA